MTALPLEPDVPEDLVGSVLFGRFRVEARLARGAVASVYRAQEQGRGPVAIKIFDPLRRADPLASARFRREFDILRGLEHPGVGRVLELLGSRDMDALVLELVEGEPLSARLARGPLSFEEARTIFGTLAESVAHCHRQGVVHRDLKPENVMLHPGRGPVILDFGVAHVSAAMTLTRTGSVIGTPRYLAPEALSSSDTDARVDVFSLGVMLLESTTGRPLRKARTIGELVGELSSPTPPVHQLAPELPPDLAGVIDRAIAKSPEARFATAAELAAALATLGPRGDVRIEIRSSRTEITCEACGSPEIVDLPFCPGCGAPVAWALEPGRFTVQLLAVPQPHVLARELTRVPGRAGRRSVEQLARRLARPPVVLVRDVSERSARAIAMSAEEQGASVEIVRSRSFVGPPIRAVPLTATRLLGLALAHFALTTVLGAIAVFFELPALAVYLSPAVVAALGYAILRVRASRPLLRPSAGSGAAIDARAVQERLRVLSSARARKLAFTAIARAAPLLLGRTSASPTARRAALEALSDALDRAGELDRHRAVLDRASKAQLRAEIQAAEARGETDRIAELSVQMAELAEIALAHDLAAQLSLEASVRISDALRASEADG